MFLASQASATEVSLINDGQMICHHSPRGVYDLWQTQAPIHSQVDAASQGMDTQTTSPRTELDLKTEQALARHLKICRLQLHNWRMAVRFRAADVAAAIQRMRIGL